MSKYVISSTTSGTKEMPFQLEPDTSETSKTIEVTSIDLCGSFVNFGHYDETTSANTFLDHISYIRSVSNGTICNTNGSWLFNDCTYLEKFDAKLPNLTNGTFMFVGCPFSTFTQELTNLTIGECMFENTNLKTFSQELPNLTDGNNMFNYCTYLENFNVDMPNLTNGEAMFYGCNGMTSFESTMNSITSCTDMFNYCDSLTSVTIHTTMTEAQYGSLFTKSNLGLSDSCTLTIDNNVSA